MGRRCYLICSVVVSFEGRGCHPIRVYVHALTPPLFPVEQFKVQFDDKSIREAVNLWFENREAAMERYGDIKFW